MELIVIVVTGLLDFALAVMISIGLDITCDAFDESRSRYVTTVFLMCGTESYISLVPRPFPYINTCVRGKEGSGWRPSHRPWNFIGLGVTPY